MNSTDEMRSAVTDLELSVRERLQSTWGEIIENPMDANAFHRLLRLTGAMRVISPAREILCRIARDIEIDDIPF